MILLNNLQSKISFDIASAFRLLKRKVRIWKGDINDLPNMIKNANVKIMFLDADYARKHFNTIIECLELDDVDTKVVILDMDFCGEDILGYRCKPCYNLISLLQEKNINSHINRPDLLIEYGCDYAMIVDDLSIHRESELRVLLQELEKNNIHVRVYSNWFDYKYRVPLVRYEDPFSSCMWSMTSTFLCVGPEQKYLTPYHITTYDKTPLEIVSAIQESCLDTVDVMKYNTNFDNVCEILNNFGRFNLAKRGRQRKCEIIKQLES